MELDAGRTPSVPPSRHRRSPVRGQDPLAAGAPLRAEPLEVYERRRDGHTLGRHCDATPDLGAARLAAHPALPATGSFTSVAVAQAAVDGALGARAAEVRAWLRSGRQRLAFTHRGEGQIGWVLRRSRWAAGHPQPLPASDVRVVLRRHSHYPAGFAVLTAYPVRRDPAAAIRPTPALPERVPVCPTPHRYDRLLRQQLANPGRSVASAFADRFTALDAVRRTLAVAGADVDDWLLCADRPRLVIEAQLGQSVGAALSRADAAAGARPVPSGAVRVVLGRAAPPAALRVIAAYPRHP